VGRSTEPRPPWPPPHAIVVHSFTELLTTPFVGERNAVCWPRALAGDFAAVAAAIAAGSSDDLLPVDAATLDSLPLAPAGRRAVDTLQADLRALRAAGHQPSLDVIRRYARDDDALLRTDVMSFHIDTANAPTDTFLCTYTGAPSEGLHPAEARRCIDEPELRAALLGHFGGDDDAEFAAWLHERCYDRHYLPRPGATPFSFGVGALWRIAVQHPGSVAPPCVHRAPSPPEPAALRLLLIS
jgi:hypothetical protein